MELWTGGALVGSLVGVVVGVHVGVRCLATHLGGLAGLLVSGALLHPGITNPVTQLKLGAVLILMLNGIFLVPVMHGLHAESHDTTAVVVDFITTIQTD